MQTPRISLLQRVQMLWVGLCAVFAPLRPRAPRAPRPEPTEAECAAAAEEYLACALAELQSLFAAWKAGTLPPAPAKLRAKSPRRRQSPRRKAVSHPRRPHQHHNTREIPQFPRTHTGKPALPPGRRRTTTPQTHRPALRLFCCDIVSQYRNPRKTG